MEFIPNKVMTDFETGLVQAIQISFPTAEILGCFYHFAQSVWRKVQELGLQLMYNDPQDVSVYFEVNWIQRRGPQKWNHYHNEEQRTNNHVEGWHSRLNKIVRKAHPNVFELVEVFKLKRTGVH